MHLDELSQHCVEEIKPKLKTQSIPDACFNLLLMLTHDPFTNTAMTLQTALIHFATHVPFSIISLLLL